MGNWYAKKLGGVHDQALIIDEETGRNVAVVYDKNDAPILAAAPVMLEALKALSAQEDWQGEDIDPDSPVGKAWAAIEAAESREALQ